jgi:hypothetical protein
LNSNGNFGIGTTAPSQRLHVNGNARIQSLPANNGNASSDRIVTVDGTGNLRSVPASSFASGGPTIVAAGKINANGSVASSSGIVTSGISAGAGLYNIVLSSALPNANYVIQLTAIDRNGTGNDAPIITYANQTANGFQVRIGDSDNGQSDLSRINNQFMFTVITY